MESVYCAALAVIELDRLETRVDSLVSTLERPMNHDLKVVVMEHLKNTISASHRLTGSTGVMLARQWRLELEAIDDTDTATDTHVEDDTT